jgi:hypothetical protein
MRGEMQRTAFRSEGRGGGATDAARCTGDQHGLSRELQIQTCLLRKSTGERHRWYAFSVFDMLSAAAPFETIAPGLSDAIAKNATVLSNCFASRDSGRQFMRKFKRFAASKSRAGCVLKRLARENANLFVHWRIGMTGTFA